MTDQPAGRPGDARSAPELEFLQCWRPLIDRVGGDGGQARAAKHMNWTTSTVSRDYKGDTLPTDERLHQLCSALQLSPNETLDLARVLRRARSARRERARDHGAPLVADADEPGRPYEQARPLRPVRNLPRASRDTSRATPFCGAGTGCGADVDAWRPPSSPAPRWS